MAFSEAQQIVIDRLQTALTEVNDKQADNAEKLEAALNKVAREQAERTEAMRVMGEKYDVQMQAQLANMIEEGNKYKESNAQMYDDLKDKLFAQGVFLQEFEEKKSAEREFNGKWQADVEAFVLKSQANASEAFAAQRRALRCGQRSRRPR